MKKILKELLVAFVLSLVPATNVMGQSKRVKPPKRHKVVKEDTNLLTEDEIKERYESKTARCNYTVPVSFKKQQTTIVNHQGSKETLIILTRSDAQREKKLHASVRG